MIQREVVRDRSTRILRIFFQESAASRCHFGAQNLALLLHVCRQFANRPDKSAVSLLPVKHLARVQRHCEIEIRCGDFREVHFSPQISTDETPIFYLCESVPIRG